MRRAEEGEVGAELLRPAVAFGGAAGRALFPDLIEGLAGKADAAPIGNDDKRIDTVELYVYTADAVRTAARKSFGLEQKPMLGKIDNLVVGNLSSN